MKIHLLNSAVMPQPGYYQLESVDKNTWAEQLTEAYSKYDFQHYIGYKSTITVVEQLTGHDMGRMNFDKTNLANGDQLFIIKLNKRVTPNEKKEDTPHIDDFVFYTGRYFTTPTDLVRSI